MKSLRKRFAKHDEGERSKHDDKILEYVLANDVDKLRSAIEKKKYSALNSADDRGRIPIFEACKLGQKDCVDVLASVDSEAIPIDSEGRTPIHVAALTGYRDCVTTLLRRGYNVNQVDEHQSTPLHLAACYGQLDVLQTLIGYQADTEARDNEQSTPLIVAAKFNQTDAASALLKNSVSVNATNGEERTALMYACDRGNAELVTQLLACGAQADRMDRQGHTARSIAQDKSHTHIISLLGGGGGGGGGGAGAGGWAGARAASKEKVLSDPDSIQKQLAQERKALTLAKEEIAMLKAQLDAFRDQDNGDGGDVEFGSDDEIDLEGGGGKAHAPKHADDSKAVVAKLRQEIETLQSKLKAQPNPDSHVREALLAAQKENEELKAKLNASQHEGGDNSSSSKEELAALKAREATRGVEVSSLQSELSGREKETGALRAQLGIYRYYLALAAKGALPAEVKEAVLEAVGAE